MSALRRLLCSLPVLACWFWADGPALGGPVEPIVGDDAASAVTFDVDSADHESTWTTPWEELDLSSSGAPISSTGAQALSGDPRGASELPIIAAPLPPAALSGLIGLATVYLYRRRHRLR